MAIYTINFENEKEKATAVNVLEYFGYKAFADGYAMRQENNYRIVLKEGKKPVPFSTGNAKYIENEKCEFLMFFIPARYSCPWATDHCKAACYVDYRYPSNVVGHINALIWTMKADFVAAVVKKIRNASKKAASNGKKLVVRIHESGDFYNQEYFNKWVAIAQAVADDSNVTLAAYTKSVEYVAASKAAIPENMIIRFSLWDDTDPEQCEIAKTLNMPVYSAVEKNAFEGLPENMKCNCENCGECHKCFENIEKMLLCVIH